MRQLVAPVIGLLLVLVPGAASDDLGVRTAVDDHASSYHWSASSGFTCGAPAVLGHGPSEDGFAFTFKHVGARDVFTVGAEQCALVSLTTAPIPTDLWSVAFAAPGLTHRLLYYPAERCGGSEVVSLRVDHVAASAFLVDFSTAHENRCDGQNHNVVFSGYARPLG